jgi:hypothetical protein
MDATVLTYIRHAKESSRSEPKDVGTTTGPQINGDRVGKRVPLLQHKSSSPSNTDLPAPAAASGSMRGRRPDRKVA